MNGKTIIKNFSVVLISVMLVTGGFVGYINFADQNEYVPAPEKEHNGEADAIAFTTVAGGIVAGSAVVSAGAIVYDRYFKDSDTVVKEDVNESDLTKVANTTLREAVHSNAIVSEGQTEGYLDSVDNSLITIEGSLEQKISQRLIGVGDNVTSEAETVKEAEDAGSKYLKTTQSNLITTHNFNTLSVKQYDDQLNTANFSGDIGAVQIAKVSTVSEYQNAVGSGNDIIILKDDIGNSESFPSTSSTDAGADLDVVDLNGYEINSSTDHVLLNDFSGNDGLTVIGDSGAMKTQASYAINAFSANGIDINIKDANIGSTVRGSGSSNSNLFVDNSSSVSGTADITSVDSYQYFQYGTGITFDTTTIANNNANYGNASDVPVATFENDNSTVSLPATNVTMNSAYWGQNNTVQVAVPYDDNGNALTSSNVIIQTPSSGISDYAVPYDVERGLNMIQNRDSLSSDAYSFVDNYSRSIWNDYLKAIAEDPDRSIYDNSSIQEELSQLQRSYDPANPESVVQTYSGIYEGTTSPSSDVIHVKNVDTGEEHKGALYSTDMAELMANTSDPSVVEAGDQFNTSGVNRTVMVNQDTGEKTELSGTYNVTLIEDQQSADVRTYEQRSTNLADQAQRLQDTSETVQRTVEDPTSVPGVSLSQDRNMMILLAIVAVAVLGGGSAGTTVVARRRRNNMSSSSSQKSSGKS